MHCVAEISTEVSMLKKQQQPVLVQHFCASGVNTSTAVVTSRCTASLSTQESSRKLSISMEVIDIFNFG